MRYDLLAGRDLRRSYVGSSEKVKIEGVEDANNMDDGGTVLGARCGLWR